MSNEIISYVEMCRREGASLQRGMNFRLRGTYSVILMSRRTNAPYNDRVEDEGATLIYEGHDVPKGGGFPIPKVVDQPEKTPSGSLTQNGHFFRAALAFKDGFRPPENVKVYEKIMKGVWSYNGFFKLVDSWQELDGARKVFKFRLETIVDPTETNESEFVYENHRRIIPSHVKREVYKRDQGRCRKCGATTELHFDHVLPYSLGGSSLVAENVQLLCARHNLAKSDNIE
jgi:HNH endonuclease